MKSNITTPCYYHPTTVVLTDDRQSFLGTLHEQLSETMPCKAFIEPHDAIDFINTVDTKNTFLNELIDDTRDTETEFLTTSFDVRKIREIAHNEKRFANISCLIVDYDMPSMNGLQMCQQLQPERLRKVMLTAEADNNIAVKAFNKEIIDKFYIKDSDDFLELFEDDVSKLQDAYFSDITSLIINDALYQQYPVMNCLKDNSFAAYFKALREKHGIVEYYLTDTEGGFILYDADAKPSYLSVKTAHELENYHDFAKHADGVDPAIVSALAQYKKVPYFLTEENMAQPPAAWLPYLHEAEKVDGNMPYYVAHIEDSSTYNERQFSVAPFMSYLKKMHTS